MVLRAGFVREYSPLHALAVRTLEANRYVYGRALHHEVQLHAIGCLSTMDVSNVSRLRRRRGIPRASITKLAGRVNEIEDNLGDPDAVDTAQRYKERLIALDAEFKTHHYSIVDAIVDETVLAEEQDILDEHDDTVSVLTDKLQKVIKSRPTAARVGDKDIQSRRLSHLRRTVNSVDTEIQAIPEDSDDTYLMQQYDDHLAEFKSELKSVHQELLTLGLEETDELFNVHDRLLKIIFDCCHRVKKLLGERQAHATRNYKGVKLPKLEVPTFDGNEIN